MGSGKTQPPRGMRDFLPADVRRREYVIGIIKEVYERYGFEPLETPAVENIETLLGKYGEEGNQLIFKILKRGIHESSGKPDLALRYDLTVPLARVYAQYQNELGTLFKRYQIQPVWRADRPAHGRFREFYQCDVDVVGSHSIVVEVELCAAVSDVLVKLGFRDFTIRLNHRQVLEKILEVAGVAQHQFTDALTALDKLDKIGTEGVWREFEARNISHAYEHMLDLFHSVEQRAAEHDTRAPSDKAWSPTTYEDWNNYAIAEMERAMGHQEKPSKGLKELKTILELSALSSACGRIRIAPNLARGLSYYTDAIMEITVPDLAGSLAGGGRYDNLIGMFIGKDVGACGFSLGLERIIVVMTEREMFPSSLTSTPADVMVSIWRATLEDERRQAANDSICLATELRDFGIRVDLYPVRNVKLGTQLAYASRRRIPLVAVIGPDERARGEVKLKDMISGDQKTLPRDQVSAAIRELLTEHR